MPTVADATKLIAKKKAKYEKLLDSNNHRERNTAQRMLERLGKAEEDLFAYQESITDKSETPEFGLGGNIQQWWDTNPEKVKDIKTTGAGLAPIALDWANQRRAINQMEAPPAPALVPGTVLNKNLDISAPLNESNRMRRTAELQAEEFADPQMTIALKQKAKVMDMMNKGKLLSQKANFRTQLENQEASINNYNTLMNTTALNRHKAEMTDFTNNRTAARANNNTAALVKGQQLLTDNKNRKSDIAKIIVNAAANNPAVMETLLSNPALAKLLGFDLTDFVEPVVAPPSFSE